MATVSLTNYASQVAEIERQKKLAELLQQQAQQPIEIQSYKGIQAPIPWSAVLAKVLGQVGGQIKEARATKNEASLGQQARQQAMSELVRPDTVTSGGYNKANPTQIAATLEGMQSYLKPSPSANPKALAASLSQSPISSSPLPPISSSLLPPVPQAPVQATPMGGAPAMPPANPIKAAVDATDVPLAERAMSGQEKINRGYQMLASGNPYLEKMSTDYISSAKNQMLSEKTLAGLNAQNLPEQVRNSLQALAVSGAKPEELVKTYTDALKPIRVGDTVQQLNASTGKYDVVADASTKWEQVDPASLPAEQRASMPPGMTILKSNHGDIKTVNVSDASSILKLQQELGLHDAERAPERAIAKAQLGVSQGQLGVSQANLGLSRQRLDLDREQKAAAVLPPDVIKEMAAQAWKGDNSVFQNLGRGAQGAQNIVNLRTEITAQGQGRPPGDMARMRAQFAGETAAQRAIGSRTGSATFANAEVPQAVALSKDAYSKLPRGQFVPFNKLRKLVDSNTSSPEQAAAFVMDEDAITSYARALSPNGIPRVADIKRGEQMLSGVNSVEAHNATLDAMQRVVQARQGAAHALLSPGSAPRAAPAPYADPNKEAAYQAWKKANRK